MASLQLCGVFFFLVMDGCTFSGFNFYSAIHSHYKTWTSQDIFYCNSDCIHLKEECHVHLGGLEGE